MGKLIVVDGLDGSGKSTQTELLAEKLRVLGKKVKLISFPDYNEKSSELVKMYLNGEFSETADGVNAYAASTFYAVDRYASYKKFWESNFLGDEIIIASRYVSSNILHQMPKLPKTEWGNFIHWLDDFEYNKLGLPKPDAVIYLDMPRDVADSLILSRYNGDERKKDIHENNIPYLKSCEQSALYAAKTQNWIVIKCSDRSLALSIDEINKTLLDTVEKLI